MSLPFDEVADAQAEMALDFASVTQLGEALARRVVKLAAAVDDAVSTANDSDDVLLLAGAAGAASWAAASANDCAAAVVALLGKGDEKTATRTLLLARRAQRHAERVQRRLQRIAAVKGGVA